MKRDWKYINSFEDKRKILSLKKLSARAGFKIAAELYDFACRIGIRFSRSSSIERALHLSKVHYRLNRVK